MQERNKKLTELAIDGSWTLFLDRDGVINVHRPNDYVKKPDEFEFLPGALDAIVTLSKFFGRIIVVTNQRGVARGILTHEDLAEIHTHMLEEIRAHGGDIHAIYAATELESDDPLARRKPGIGMGLQAKHDHPDVNFTRSLMIGDSDSDIRFGQALGMWTIRISSRLRGQQDAPEPDYQFSSLAEAAQAMASLSIDR